MRLLIDRFGPYFVEPLVVGLHEQTNEVCLCDVGLNELG